MTTKHEINDVLRMVLKDDIIPIWWEMKLPGLSGEKPKSVFETDPDKLLEYVKGYLDESFS